MAKLEIAVLIGDESKQFLANLTKQIDRLEAIGEAIGEYNTTQGNGLKAEQEPVEAPAKKETKAKAEKAKPDPKLVETVDDLVLDGEEMDAPLVTTVEDVRAAAKQFAAKHGKDKTINLFKKFKATSIAEINKGDYSKFVELVKKYV